MFIIYVPSLNVLGLFTALSVSVCLSLCLSVSRSLSLSLIVIVNCLYFACVALQTVIFILPASWAYTSGEVYAPCTYSRAKSALP